MIQQYRIRTHRPMISPSHDMLLPAQVDRCTAALALAEPRVQIAALGGRGAHAGPPLSPRPRLCSAHLKAFPQAEIKPRAQRQTSGSAGTAPGSKMGAGECRAGWERRERGMKGWRRDGGMKGWRDEGMEERWRREEG